MSKNYENGKIYIIYSPHSDNHYIGSCTTDLKTRLDRHNYYYKQFVEKTNTYTHYMAAFEVLKFGDVEIELICDYPSKNKKELEKAEGYVIRDFRKNQGKNCVNIHVAGRTKKEYRKEEAEHIKILRANKHKERMENDEEYKKTLQKKSIAHYSKNKDVMNKKATEKFKCECGGSYSRCHKSCHLKSKKHLAYINNL